MCPSTSSLDQRSIASATAENGRYKGGNECLQYNQKNGFLDGEHFRQSKDKMYLIFSCAECSWNKYILSLE